MTHIAAAEARPPAIPLPGPLPGPAADAGAAARKAALRAAALGRRARAHARLRGGAGPALARRFREAFADRLAGGGVAALYAPMGTEIDVGPLAAALAAAGMRTALPAVVAAGAPLAFGLWRPGEPTRRHRFGMLEPARLAPATPGLVVVPLVAFDRTGARLGHGGGFYDRTLRSLRAAGPVLAVGAAYAGQEAPWIPAEAHDEPLDAVVTERGLVPCRAAGR